MGELVSTIAKCVGRFQRFENDLFNTVKHGGGLQSFGVSVLTAAKRIEGFQW